MWPQRNLCFVDYDSPTSSWTSDEARSHDGSPPPVRRRDCFHEHGRYQQKVLHGVYPWSFAAKALWHAETFRCSQRNKDNSRATRSRSVLKSTSICLNDDACWHFRGSLEHRKHHARTMHSSRERAHAHRHVQIHNMLIHYRLVCSCLLRCAFATDIVKFP